MENRGRERTGHDRQHIQICAEPEREQLARLAVSLVERDLVDGVLFDARGFVSRLQRVTHPERLLPRTGASDNNIG